MEEFPELASNFSMSCLVDGIIPPSAGLSSSSALVVSAAIATIKVIGAKITKTDLADLCAKSERFIGTQGGGMDQAIEILAEAGTANLINFNPLRTTSVQLPPGANFVVANSLAESNKAAGGDYNARVAECRLATKILAKEMNITGGKNLLRLGDFQSSSGITLSEAVAKVQEILHEAPYTLSEVSSLLQLTENEIIEECLNENTKSMTEFQLRRRALHVFSEAKRVYDFKEACEEKGADSLQQLGNFDVRQS